MNKKIVISVNTAWNIFNFRAGLIKALVSQGYEVVAVAPGDEYVGRLQALGCRFINLPMDNKGTHPGRDLFLLARYYDVLRTEQPIAYLGYTIKPNVYGSIAARALHIPVINNIAGLGTAFIHQSLLTHIARMLYKLSLQRSSRIFFQNADDQHFFIREGLARPEQTDRVPGSGMDLSRYVPLPPAPLQQRPFRFLLVSRLLRDKGVEEFAEAARLVGQKCGATQCHLLGFVDVANRNAISMEQIRSWEGGGVLRYLGKTDDVRPYLSDADCVVLPSYREGVPRSLLEAAAMARPIIATDTVGCKDVVDDQVNGLLCKVRDAHDLAEKMVQMIRMPPHARQAMGLAGRRKVERQFDEKLVIQKYLDMIGEIAGGAEGRAGRIGKSALSMRSE